MVDIKIWLVNIYLALNNFQPLQFEIIAILIVKSYSELYVVNCYLKYHYWFYYSIDDEEDEEGFNKLKPSDFGLSDEDLNSEASDSESETQHGKTSGRTKKVNCE